jgi:hypothetical protein
MLDNLIERMSATGIIQNVSAGKRHFRYGVLWVDSKLRD